MSFKPPFNLKMAIVLSWGLALLIILLFLGPQRIIDLFSGLTPRHIRGFIASFGLLSALVYLLIYALRPFFFLPVTPFTIAGGFLFGNGLGLVLSITGRLISATITFSVSRYLFRDYIRSRIRDKYARWEERLEKKGLVYVAILRMLPMLPFDVVGYVSGVSGIGYRKYIVGTFLGDLPGIIVLTFLGDSLSDPGSTRFYLSVLLAIVVAAASWLYIIIFVRKETGIKNI